MIPTSTNAYGQFDLKSAPKQAAASKPKDESSKAGAPGHDHAAMMKGMKLKRGMERKVVVW